MEDFELEEASPVLFEPLGIIGESSFARAATLRRLAAAGRALAVRVAAPRRFAVFWASCGDCMLVAGTGEYVVLVSLIWLLGVLYCGWVDGFALKIPCSPVCMVSMGADGNAYLSLRWPLRSTSAGTSETQK